MRAQEIIEQIKALAPADGAEVTRFVLQEDDSWVPESFKEGMSDIAAGRAVDLDKALEEHHPEDK
jgi:predicted transcriptional regulator